METYIDTKTDSEETSMVCNVYHVNPEVKNNFSYLIENGKLDTKSSCHKKMETVPAYMFFVVSSGAGVVSFPKDDYKLSEGDCMFLNCTSDKFDLSSDCNWNMQWCVFSGHSVPYVYEKYIAQNQSPIFHTENILLMSESVDGIGNMNRDENLISALKIDRMFTELMEQILYCSKSRETQSVVYAPSPVIYEIKEYIDEHYMEKIQLKDLSQKFFFNKGYLCKNFRRTFHVTINNYIILKRIKEAKIQLMFSNQTVEEIGYNVGFSSPNYFSRAFKKEEGMSPREYRNHMQNQSNALLIP